MNNKRKRKKKKILMGKLQHCPREAVGQKARGERL
jgi:hypothetical protein